METGRNLLCSISYRFLFPVQSVHVSMWQQRIYFQIFREISHRVFPCIPTMYMVTQVGKPGMRYDCTSECRWTNPPSQLHRNPAWARNFFSLVPSPAGPFAWPPPRAAAGSAHLKMMSNQFCLHFAQKRSNSGAWILFDGFCAEKHFFSLNLGLVVHSLFMDWKQPLDVSMPELKASVISEPLGMQVIDEDAVLRGHKNSWKRNSTTNAGIKNNKGMKKIQVFRALSACA